MTASSLPRASSDVATSPVPDPPPRPSPGAALLGEESGFVATRGHTQRGTPRPGVLLDRDGTIISDDGYVGASDRVRLIDGAASAIATFNRAGIPVAVVTNQAGVARGFYTVDDVEQVHRCIDRLLAAHGAHIDRFLYCPYHPDGAVAAFSRTSEDRKPRPGMALAAAAALNLDLRASWVIGDRWEDVGLAASVGAAAIYLGDRPCPYSWVTSCRSLAEAAPLVLKRLAA